MNRKLSLSALAVAIVATVVIFTMACVNPTTAPSVTPTPAVDTSATPTLNPTSVVTATPAVTVSPTATPAPAPFLVTSTAFSDGGTIPAIHSGDGQDRSPPLNWSGVPAGTRSFAVICDDPDAPGGAFTHWLIFNVNGDAGGLPEGVPRQSGLTGGSSQGTNDFGNIGYGGPAPPPGSPHHYRFKVYALNAKLDLTEGATKAALENAIKSHVLAEAGLTGMYGR